MKFNIELDYAPEELSNSEIREVDTLIKLLEEHPVETLEEMSKEETGNIAWSQVITALKWKRRHLKGNELQRRVNKILQEQ